MRVEVIAQLIATQQRVDKLTPIAEEVDSLRSWVAEAC